MSVLFLRDTPTNISLRWRCEVNGDKVTVRDCQYGKKLTFDRDFIYSFRDPDTGRFDYGINRVFADAFDEEVFRDGEKRIPSGCF